VIHGDCAGADAIAGQIAAELGLAVEAMAKNAADYARHKKAAWKGLNERMLAAGAELILVFHPTFDASKGSKHLAELAALASVEVRIFRRVTGSRVARRAPTSARRVVDGVNEGG